MPAAAALLGIVQGGRPAETGEDSPFGLPKEKRR
jgi:hypothetical protein